MPTFSYILDPRTPQKRDGTKTLVLRITDKKTRSYIATSISVKPEHWDSVTGKIKRAHDPINFKELNANLANQLAKCEVIVSEFEANKIPFTIDYFKSKFLIPKEIPGVIEYFERTILMLRERKSFGNAKVYYHAKNAVSRFNKGNDMPFQAITPTFLQNFESFLIKKGCSGNTIHHYMRTLRALFYRAVEHGYANAELNPFYNNYTRKGYRFSHLQKATSKRALSREDLLKIINLKPAPLSKEEDARLIFLFSYYAWGMNIIDIAKLRWDKNIHGNYIVYARTKTRYTKTFRVPIIQPIQEILDICREYSPTGYIFQMLNDDLKDMGQQYIRIHTETRWINRVLKQMGEDLKIPIPLTTYVARHTFASILKSHGTSASIIKEMMGHTKEETTVIYLKEFENETLDRTSELLNLK